MILGRNILTVLGFYLKFCQKFIGRGGVPFERSTEPMIDLGTYEFKYLNTVKITPEEYFMNACVEGVF